MRKIILIAALAFAMNRIGAMTSVDPVVPGFHPSTVDLQYLNAQYGENGWYGDIAKKDLPTRISFNLNKIIETFIKEDEEAKAEGIETQCYRETIDEFTLLLSYLPRLTKEEITKDQFLDLLKKSQDKMLLFKSQNSYAEEWEDVLSNCVRAVMIDMITVDQEEDKPETGETNELENSQSQIMEEVSESLDQGHKRIWLNFSFVLVVFDKIIEDVQKYDPKE